MLLLTYSDALKISSYLFCKEYYCWDVRVRAPIYEIPYSLFKPWYIYKMAAQITKRTCQVKDNLIIIWHYMYSSIIGKCIFKEACFPIHVRNLF